MWWALAWRRHSMTAMQPGLVVAGQAGPGVTAVMPAPPRGPSGLQRARMTDLAGAELYVGWVPAGARLVTRGQRVFMHWQGNEWRQVPVVKLGEDGRPI